MAKSKAKYHQEKKLIDDAINDLIKRKELEPKLTPIIEVVKTIKTLLESNEVKVGYSCGDCELFYPDKELSEGMEKALRQLVSHFYG